MKSKTYKKSKRCKYCKKESLVVFKSRIEKNSFFCSEECLKRWETEDLFLDMVWNSPIDTNSFDLCEKMVEEFIGRVKNGYDFSHLDYKLLLKDAYDDRDV